MKNYQSKQLHIKDIKVDQKNPRFDEVFSQKDAITMMLDKQDKKIIALAEHIVKNGLNPTATIAVFKEDGEYVSGDGNRRVTVLKCLHNPGLVSDMQLRKKLKAFAKTPFPRKVACIVFKNRIDANFWISLNHNAGGKGEGLIPWGSAERDRFNQTASIGTQIMDAYVLPKNRSRYAKTTVERFFNYKGIKASLNIVLDENGIIRFSGIDQTKTKLLIKKLAGVTVSVVYSAKDARAFYEQHIPAQSPRPTPRLTPRPKRKSQASTQDRKTVIPGNFVLSITTTKANNVFHELKKINVINFPNASAILLRMFLELTVNSYSKKMGITHDPKANLREKFHDSYTTMNLDKNETKVLDTIYSNKSNPAHTSILNSYTHNPNHHPDSSSVKNAFDNLSVFFQRAYP